MKRWLALSLGASVLLAGCGAGISGGGAVTSAGPVAQPVRARATTCVPVRTVTDGWASMRSAR